jgi:hypothetical protein
MESPQSSGPNPLCEIGRTHPRDRHRMKPADGSPGVWVCPRHDDMFATIVDKARADSLERGDPFPMPDGRLAVVVRHGDERGGGVILYYRDEG